MAPQRGGTSKSVQYLNVFRLFCSYFTAILPESIFSFIHPEQVHRSWIQCNWYNYNLSQWQINSTPCHVNNERSLIIVDILVLLLLT